MFFGCLILEFISTVSIPNIRLIMYFFSVIFLSLVKRRSLCLIFSVFCPILFFPTSVPDFYQFFSSFLSSFISFSHQLLFLFFLLPSYVSFPLCLFSCNLSKETNRLANKYAYSKQAKQANKHHTVFAPSPAPGPGEPS